jgi:L-threonylcarbamoyladenylate synthase
LDSVRYIINGQIRKNDVSLVYRVCEILKAGGVVVANTDTVYGLLADASNKAAVLAVFELKERQRNSPMPILVSSMDMAMRVAKFDKKIEQLADYCWNVKKLPLTIVLRAKDVLNEVRAGRDTVAVRLPNHALLLEIIKKLGGPIVATSANITGSQAAVTFEDAKRQWASKVSLVIDGGKSETNLASTILDASGERYEILREGAVSVADIFPKE